jgi:hypothetical protein
MVQRIGHLGLSEMQQAVGLKYECPGPDLDPWVVWELRENKMIYRKILTRKSLMQNGKRYLELEHGQIFTSVIGHPLVNP